MRDLPTGNRKAGCPEEHEELMSYVKAGHLLALLKRKEPEDQEAERFLRPAIGPVVSEEVRRRANDVASIAGCAGIYPRFAIPRPHHRQQHGGTNAYRQLDLDGIHRTTAKREEIAGSINQQGRSRSVQPTETTVGEPSLSKWEVPTW